MPRKAVKKAVETVKKVAKKVIKKETAPVVLTKKQRMAKQQGYAK